MASSCPRVLLCCLVAAAALAGVAQAVVVQPLDGAGWRLTNGNGSIAIDNVRLPNYPLEILRAAGIISDPNWRYGELESRWVALDTWTFSTELEGAALGADLLGSREVVLQLGGVDTFASVSLNGQPILSTNNFHRSWAVPVKRLLRPDGPNALAITIRPAAQESVSLKARHPYTVPALAQMGSIGSYIFARKPASDFGWDWGPAYAPSGIHGSIRLVGYSTATLSSAYVKQFREAAPASEGGDVFHVDITSQLLLPAGGDDGELLLEMPGLSITRRQEISLPDQPGYSSPDGAVAVSGGVGGMRTATVSSRISVPADAVKLWWPVGYGAQPLYDVHVAFLPKSVAAACADAAPASRRRQLLGGAGGDAADAASEEHEEEQAAKQQRTFAAAAKDAPSSAAAAAAEEACRAAAAAFTTISRRIGFRTVELVRLPIHEAVRDLFPPGEAGWEPNARFYQQKDSSDGNWAADANGTWRHFDRKDDQSEVEGESFYFKINGLPIYMKGANYIPSHIIHTNVTREMLGDTLAYALESNMNMLRVWGGGRYPVDFLFDFADEHGLLLWMETMFACSPYPRDPAFLSNVAAEVAQQAQRLSWHPSVAIWGGNNEIEGSLNWYAESRSNRALFANDYQTLFVDTIRKELRAINPHIPFVDSSPSNGIIADNDQEYVKRWGDDWDWRYGDTHWYAYESDCEDWTTYPKSKFISEFGSQSYPTLATYAEATSAADWQVDNPMTGFRNRRFGNGLEVFEAQFRRHFRLPASWAAPSDPAQAFKLFRSFFYITHMQQARCYEAAINYWRRLRSQPAGLTSGVLYWQLNDNSAFASWSGYDYGGRWKPLGYSIKRMFAPLQVQLFTDPASDTAVVFLVNDHTSAVETHISVSLLSLADEAAGAGKDEACAMLREAPGAAVASVDFTVPPGFASEAWRAPIATLLARRAGCSRSSCYLAVTATGGSGAARGQTSEAQMWLVPLKDINLPNPGLRLSGFAAAPPTVAAGSSSGESADGLYTGDAEAMARATNSYEDAVVGGDVASAAGGFAPNSAADDAALQTPLAQKQPEDGGSAAASDTLLERGPAGVSRARLFAHATGGKQLPSAAAAASSSSPASSKAPRRPRRAAAAATAAAAAASAAAPAASASAAAQPITFILSASRPAALTTLVTKYRGRFSDDAFTALHPCAPHTVTFYPHASVGPLSAEALAADLAAESLFDHQFGSGSSKAAGGGGGSKPAAAAAAPKVPPTPGSGAPFGSPGQQWPGADKKAKKQV